MPAALPGDTIIGDSATVRRETIVTQPNPVRRLDSIASFDATVRQPGHPDGIGLTLRYVPDGLIVGAGGWTAYLQEIAEFDWPSLSELAGAILSDASNQLVPRWVSVELRAPAHAAVGGEMRVAIEDRQPNWQNPELLSRVRYA